MKKILGQKIEKIWGYEIWLSSPIKGKQSLFEDNTPVEIGPLVKLIKTNMPLSIQVHPDDKLAMKLEGEKNGKNESWMILENKKNAELVIGLKNYDQKYIREALKKGTFEENLLKIHVNKKDFFNIPAGLVHGIGADITILEVQQPSDITYRYFDYSRLENGVERELHLEKAIMAQKDIKSDLSPIAIEPLTFRNEVGTQIYHDRTTLIKNPSIIVNLDNFNTYYAYNEIINLNNFVEISCERRKNEKN